MDLPPLADEGMAPPGMARVCPPRVKDGRPNPDHWRWRFAFVLNFDHLVMTGEREAPRGWDLKKSLDALMMEAKTFGIDPKHLMDARSDGEKMLDAAVDIVTQPDRLLEWADDVLAVLEKGFDAAETKMLADFESRLAAKVAETGRAPPEDALGKVRAILSRVRTLRERARHPIPKTSAIDGDSKTGRFKYRDHVVEAAHLARYMLYVMRSTISGKRGADSILKLGMHHIRIIGDIWQAEKGAMFQPASTGEWDSRIDIDRNVYHFEGVLEGAPPGHGKTTVCTGWCMKHISMNPDAQGTWLHDKEEHAQANVEMVKHAFDPDNEYGRRNLALFPGHELAKVGNTTGRLQLKLDRPVKAPTLVGRSVWSSDLGTDNSFQIIDDVVPQKDIHEHSRRAQRVDMVATQWRSRLRENGFRIIVGTMWHHEDVLAKMAKAVDRRSNPLWMVKRIQKCERRVLHNGRERFIPLWPEMYPARALSAIYHGMENKRLWAANYEGNPNPDEDRIIRKLRYYDPELPDHELLLKDGLTRGHVSLDPAWTNREHSDRAGMVVAVVGKIEGVLIDDDGREVRASERQVRITHARADKATADGMRQNLVWLIDAAADAGVEIDELHVETNSAGTVIADNLENEFGVSVQRHFAGKSKEIRLRRVMGMIDDSNKQRRACVLFPGKAKRDIAGDLVLDDQGGVVVEPDPEWDWMYRQFLEFGFTSEDHCLDATTQLCNALSSEVEPGKGVVTRAVKKAIEKSADRKAIEAVLARVRRKPNAGGWEGQFISDNWR